MKELYEINEEAYPFKNGNAYAYDMLGNRVATTDALGNAVYKAFDPFGNLLSEWGATYPVRYTYDTQNRRISLSTTRDGAT
jgi:YD repeat-containing protein